MNEHRMRRRLGALTAAVMLLSALSPRLGAISDLPDAMTLETGGAASVAVSLPLSAEADQDDVVVLSDGDQSLSLTAGEETGTTQVIFRLLGLVPVKTMTVTVERPRILIPGGKSLGVALQTQGMVVVGSSDLGNTPSPARQAGILPGDVIQTVNGEAVTDVQTLAATLAEAQTARVGILRGGEAMEMDVTPAVDPRDGARKLGVWVRQSTAGVGTLTYYDPESGEYGALGHAITDADTGVVFPVGEGAVYENQVVGVTKGSKGSPGELTGAFFEEENMLGEIQRNTDFGVFGQGEAELADGLAYPDGLPAAKRSEVHTGKAQILSTIDGSAVRAYDCEIEKLYSQSEPETRSMVIRVTDPELLRNTGGIVQGMSGSPILQDGKIVGAVTHVFVSDPTRGYGVYIDWMLDASGT